jgi:2,4-dienoyl-CoA reductase-like NADH-dependent reductase (Old Yellow Enzyme family)
MTVRNRIVMLPHGTGYCDPRSQAPSQRHVAYYRERARGGVSLILLESSNVSAAGRFVVPLVLSSDRRNVPGYRRIAEAVHKEGARICGQLTHYGRASWSPLTRQPVVGASTRPFLGQEQALALDAEGMQGVIADYVAAARNFADAGFDGVEVKAAHDGLPREFLSPLGNDRRDEYGGSVENRMRFPLDLLRAIRAEIGSEVALGIRLVADEGVPGGRRHTGGSSSSSAEVRLAWRRLGRPQRPATR